MALAHSIRWILIFFVILITLASGAITWAYAVVVRPGPSVAERVLVIPRGAGVSRIAELLEREKIIASAFLFRAAVRTIDRGKLLRAGEFSFPGLLSTRGVIDLLHRGDTVVRRLTIAEGLTVQQVVAQLANTDGLTGPIISVPGEGALLPETYHFSYGDGRDALVGRMQSQMTAAIGEIWARRKPNLPLRDAGELLVLASIVEKETGVSAERAQIAGVFVNRLRRGMRLQSDPTVIYGLTRGRTILGRPLTRRDLQQPTPYNTYLNRGLPPAPISNPGRASLEAVANPAVTRDLYFVADGTGGHAFARTLAEHNRNVARWRAAKRKQQADRP